ncbi:MAG: hypothetical protein WC248_06995 [Candidatus Methanomethylophilaceae archaeon]
MVERRYVHTTSQLIDRLCIVTLKSIKIPENKEAYEKEARDIMHDLDMVVDSKIPEFGKLVRAVIVNAVANEIIWQNESHARAGEGSQDHLLRFTHSVNGVRTVAMNVISNILGERVDLKVDCLASDVCIANGYDFAKIF